MSRVRKNTRRDGQARPAGPSTACRRRARVGATAAVLGITAAILVATAQPQDLAPAAAQPTHPMTAQPAAAATASRVSPRPVDEDILATLPEATTYTTLPAAPRDPRPHATPGGRVLHPTRAVTLYSSPGGPAIATLPPTQLGADTWVPVVAAQPGWAQVLLPVRPNGSTAWIVEDPAVIREAYTAYRLHVDRARFTLRLLREGIEIDRWTVGVGKPSAITPAGRTFLLASIADTQVTYSPIVLPLGSHSDTHLTYGGGPGTVGIHGWPDRTVFGTPSSDGCIRVPADALRLLAAEIPLGTPVLVT